jgi:hypothetical protein
MLHWNDRTRRGIREALIVPLVFFGLAGICLYLVERLVS